MWLLLILLVTAAWAAAQGMPGLVLLALVLALVLARLNPSSCTVPTLGLAEGAACPRKEPQDPGANPEADSDPDPSAEAEPDPSEEAEPDPAAEAAAVETDPEPAPAGGLSGYSHDMYVAAQAESAVVGARIPMHATKDDPIPEAAWDAAISSTRSEIGKTNLPLPDGAAIQAFTQFCMKDLCHKKDKYMVPVPPPALHEDAG